MLRWKLFNASCRDLIRRSILAAIVAATVSCPLAANAASKHPLDSLSADELIVLRDTLANSNRFSIGTNFTAIQLEEPTKPFVQEFREGSEIPRKAQLAAVDYDKGKTYRVVIDLGNRQIDSITDLGTLQPGLSRRDLALARMIVDADPRIKEALAKRGLKIPGRVSDAVYVHFGAIGYDPSLEDQTNRLMRVWFAADQNAVNIYSPVLNGVMAIVDLYSKRVIRLHDAAGVPPSATSPDAVFDLNIPEARSASPRQAPPQADRGPIQVDGAVVSWRNWQFRYGFNLREGLVLYQIAFNDHGRKRPIAYRASVANLVTLYADKHELWSSMEYSEEANFGLGYLSTDVRPGREVPYSALTLSSVLPDPSQPRFSEPASDRVYVYERDAGALMYYTQDGRAVHAHATELVVGFLVSIGNYAYGLNWVFKLDGSFDFEAELAGQILTKFVAAKECAICKSVAEGVGANGESRTYEDASDQMYGTLVHSDVVGVNHQHWFNLRIDFDIDGPNNAVMENNVKRLTPRERFFTVTRTVFGKAVDAKRTTHDEMARTWTIYNPSSVNSKGRPAGYTVVPGENAATIIPETRQKGIMGFTFYHFWATPNREGQLYADGAYPNQAKSSYADTLYHYANDEPIYNRDIVVWYSMGDTHAPRPEDYPLMPNKKISVSFRPDGFFDTSAGRPIPPAGK